MAPENYWKQWKFSQPPPGMQFHFYTLIWKPCTRFIVISRAACSDLMMKMSNIVIERKVDVRLKAFLLHSSAESNNFKWSCELCKKRFSPHVRLRNYLDATREFSSYFHWHNYRAFRFLDWRKKERKNIAWFGSFCSGKMWSEWK